MVPDAALVAPSPDTAVKGLIGAMDALQQQQEHTEARRLAAEQAALAAQAEQASLKGQLHEALRRAADLDDQEQAVQAELEACLLEQAQHAEQLRLATRRLTGLRAETSAGSAGAGARDAQAQAQELAQKQALAAELQRRLCGLGIEEATLAQLCADNEAHSSAAAAGPCCPQQQQAGAAEGQQQWLDGNAAAPGQLRAAWLGGNVGGGGLLASLRRRGSTAGRD